MEWEARSSVEREARSSVEREARRFPSLKDLGPVSPKSQLLIPSLMTSKAVLPLVFSF